MSIVAAVNSFDHISSYCVAATNAARAILTDCDRSCHDVSEDGRFATGGRAITGGHHVGCRPRPPRGSLGRGRRGGPRRARTAALPLEPARRRQAHHQLRRRQHLGQGDGERPADGPRGGGALGQGFRGRRRHDEARRLRHALHGQAGTAPRRLSRPRARGRDGGASAPLHLRAEYPRRLDRHAAPRLPAVSPRRPHASRRRDRRGGDAQQPGDHKGYLRRRDRLAAVAPPGFRARPDAVALRGREPEGQGRRAGKPRALHLGRRRAVLLRHDAAHHQQGHRLVRRAGRGRGALRRCRGREPAGRHAARRRGAADAGDPRPHRHGGAQGRPFRRRRRRAASS